MISSLSVRDTRLREHTGLSVVGIWQRGSLKPAFADTIIREDAVIVVAGLTAARHARDATDTIPVVVTTSSDMVDAGVIRTTLGEILGPIDSAHLRKAHALIESGKARGKVVLEGWSG